jgi:hypothetical protein
MSGAPITGIGFFSNARPQSHRGALSHSTQCRCGDAKEPWALLCRDCWLALPVSLRSKITLRRYGKTTEDQTGAVSECFQWLNANGRPRTVRNFERIGPMPRKKGARR